MASLVRLAQAKSSAQLIAEKVEPQAQYQQVADLGVGLFQGYWFAKPVMVQGCRNKADQSTELSQRQFVEFGHRVEQ